nr:MAG TPA_asm: hypothetical protein [Caudoviricetes sp.]
MFYVALKANRRKGMGQFREREIFSGPLHSG